MNLNEFLGILGICLNLMLSRVIFGLVVTVLDQPRVLTISSLRIFIPPMSSVMVNCHDPAVATIWILCTFSLNKPDTKLEWSCGT